MPSGKGRNAGQSDSAPKRPREGHNVEVAMDWRDRYNDNLLSLHEEVKHLKSGDRIVIPMGREIPPLLVAQIMYCTQP